MRRWRMPIATRTMRIIGMLMDRRTRRESRTRIGIGTTRWSTPMPIRPTSIIAIGTEQRNPLSDG
jgi:hypothetical protein